MRTGRQRRQPHRLGRARGPKNCPNHRHPAQRRPPRDPVNAELSLSYTMLYAQAAAACWAAGLDPALGALHTLSHGRAALACDLMEPYRPLIDLWVWHQFRQGNLRAEHFGHDGAGACLLSKAGRGHFYPAWEQQAHHHQRSLLRYARAMDKALQNGSPQAAWSHLLDSPADAPKETDTTPQATTPTGLD
ncbi:MAG: CRISPR-associated endonuclease Cas1 [Burkholderiales bacterium]